MQWELGFGPESQEEKQMQEQTQEQGPSIVAASL